MNPAQHPSPDHSSTPSPQMPLAVVGLSALFPKAATTDEFWSNIRRGVDAITEVPASHWNPDDYFDSNQKTPDMTYARRGGFLSPVPFDPLEFGISPNNLEAIDTSQLLGLVGAKRALEHAGYGTGRHFDRSRVGCILGVTGTLEMVIPLGARLGHPRWKKALEEAGVPDEVAVDVIERISQSYVPWQENSFPGLLGNVVAGRIANRLDLHGTNCVVDAACASSLSAIHLAALELTTGRSDMVVTGGVDTFNDIFMFMCFSKTPALSASGDAKPFSEEADGTILGEGVGMLVLKRLADAERDGDRIYAVLKGIGTSSDGAGNAVYAPKSEGQIRCLNDAYRTAGVSPATVELVEAHGTGTKVGDATEVSGLMQVYQASGRQGTWCAVGSVKSQIGHTKAAAGAAGVIKAILALQHRVLPPTIKIGQPSAAFLSDQSPFYVNTVARPWVKPSGHPRRAAISAFGFGGSNFHCVLEESPQRFDESEWDGDVQVIALSADSIAGLSDKLRSQVQPLATSEWKSIRAFGAASRQSFSAEHSIRLVFAVERDKADLSKLVTSALTMLERYPDKRNWSTPDGVHFGCGAREGKLGVLFPGQGSQYVGMLRDLVCRFPSMLDTLDEANEVFAAASPEIAANNRLSDFIYPQPAFSTEVKTRQSSELQSTQVAQPAIGAVSLALLSVLDHFGIQAEAVAGHSYGELTALCASHRFSPRDLFRLSSLRGRLMAAAQETAGGMLAVLAPLAQIESALNEMSLDLVVANHNSPTQVVLSGRIPDIDRAASLFAGRNIRGKKLPVAAAFHSPLVAPASSEFRSVLEEIDFSPSSMPVYANSTASEYPSEPNAARDLLANQLARPVHFVNEIEQMYADGVRTFVEVGPGGVLTGLVNSILDGREYRAISVDASNGKRDGLIDLASALSSLAAAGYAVRWDQWDPQGAALTAVEDSRRMRIPISGANYFKPRPPIPPRTRLKLAESCSETPTECGISVEQPSPIAPNEGVPLVPRNDHPVPTDLNPTLTNDTANSSSAFRTSSSGPTEPITVSGTTNAGTLDAIREALAALQQMQQETSRLHQRFLDEQASALETLARLANGQSSRVGTDHLVADGIPVQPPVDAEPVSKDYYEIHREDLKPEEDHSHEHSQFLQSFTADELPDREPSALPVPDAAHSEVAQAFESSLPPVEANLQSQAIPSAPVESNADRGDRLTAEAQKPLEISPLAETVLAVVSEKTGYPTEMLKLDMSLDHDLGIDSIKRVEILSALQERVEHLPAFQPDELGSLHTLQDVVTLADSRMPSTASNIAPAAHAMTVPGSNGPLREVVTSQPPIAVSALASPVPASPVVPADLGRPSLADTVLKVVAEKTGYPIEMLNLDMSLDHDLGIDSIKRVEILSAMQERVPNLPAFQPDELGSLHTLNDVVRIADARFAETAPHLTKPAEPVPTAPQVATRPTVTFNQTPVIHPTVPVIPVVDHSPSKPAVVPVNPAPAASLGDQVLAVVSEKTGYPIEMLALDMSLDHDLGIDSIKRVEILSALQEKVPNLPAFQPEELGALHTLRDVVTLADARVAAANGSSVNAPVAKVATPILPAASPVPAMSHKELPSPLGPSHPMPIKAPALAVAPVIPTRTSVSPSAISRSVVRSVAIPPAANRPRLQIAAGSEIWITEDGLGLSLLVAGHLKQLGLKPRIVALDQPKSNAIPDRLAGLIVIAPQQDMDETQLWHAVEWLQRVGPTLRKVGTSSSAIFATVSRLDGQFGFGSGKRLRDPVSGGLAGLAKCAAREWPEVTSRAFDISGEWSAAHVAAAMLATELLHSEPGEVGLSSSGPQALQVVNESVNERPESPPVNPGDVIVVTGGARGVTAEAVFAMATAWRPRLVILGRSPGPAPEPDWLASLSTEAEIKQAIIARSLSNTTPKVINQQYQEITAAREVSRQIQRLRSTGASTIYHSVDIRDPAAVKPLLMSIQRDFGVIRGIVHGAGVLADQRIEDKTWEQFERVYRTKVGGLRTLLECVDCSQLRLLALFSSYTARYGRVGQVDYAIANEVLNKQARQFSIQYPQCRVAAFNWGPWDGGMVQGGLKKLFASEGVDLIPIEAGASALVHEFNQTESSPVEVLILGKPSSAAPVQVAPSPATVTTRTAHPATGWIQQATAPNPAVPSPSIPNAAMSKKTALVESYAEVVRPAAGTTASASGVLAGGLDEFTAGHKVAFERMLDVTHHPFLESHVIGGKAVLPVAMMFEWLAHGAIHGNPGLELRGFDEFKVFQGIRISRHNRVQVRVMCGKPIRNDADYQVPVRMIGHVDGRDAVHARAVAILAPEYPTPPARSIYHSNLRHYSLDISSAYAQRLFHGQKLKGIAAIDGCSEEGIIVTTRMAPPATTWMSDPVRGGWLADPLAIDVALQAVILWSQEQRGKPCLPCAIGSYRQFRRAWPLDGIRIIIKVQPPADRMIRCDIEFVDLHGEVVARMEGCENVIDASLTGAFKRNRLEV